MSRRLHVVSGHLSSAACAHIDDSVKIDSVTIADPKMRIAAGTIWNIKAQTLGNGGTLKGRTLFITGGSRGIGFAIAKRAARDGANIIIAAKTADAHPTLPGTIHTAAAECERLGGKALACVVDVRDEASIEQAVKAGAEKFGGIDILVNCASAIFPAPTQNIDLKRLDLMWQITTRAPLLTAKHCLPYLKESATKGNNPHILNCSPPVNFYGKWPEPANPNYMVCKMGMSTGAMALGNELEGLVGANTLWPATAIATSAVNHMAGNDPKVIDDMYMQIGRLPEIQADAAHAIFTSKNTEFTKNQCIDEDVMLKAGCEDLSIYDYSRSGSSAEERLKNIIRV